MADGPVLLLDASSLLFRSFFALPDMRTSDGIPTGGLYGLSTVLLKLLREHRPRGLAFAVDRPEPTFRHEAFDGYKAHRQRTPSPLVRQLERLPAFMEATGAPVHGHLGFEADDVLASLATVLGDQSIPVLVVTGDTDLLQVAAGCVAVWFVGRRGGNAVRYDEAAVRKRYAIEPSQIPTYKALVGDPSDNLPGLPGVGPKTAARWIREHGAAAGIVAAASTLSPARLRPVVEQAADDLPRFEDLATVRRGLPLEPPLWAPFTVASRTGLARQFSALSFRSLVERLNDLPSA